MLDGNPETYWNDESARGKDAWLRFRFSRPVQITEIELQNLQDETKFLQNYRIQGVQIGVDDIDVDLSHRLEDTQEAQRVPIASLDTTVLTISVTSTYPAQAVGGRPRRSTSSRCNRFASSGNRKVAAEFLRTRITPSRTVDRLAAGGRTFPTTPATTMMVTM